MITIFFSLSKLAVDGPPEKSKCDSTAWILGRVLDVRGPECTPSNDYNSETAKGAAANSAHRTNTPVRSFDP